MNALKDGEVRMVIEKVEAWSLEMKAYRGMEVAIRHQAMSVASLLEAGVWRQVHLGLEWWNCNFKGNH